jgi:multiple sugar transport system permease protein
MLLAFLLPSLAVLIGLTAIPFGYLTVTSFTSLDLAKADSFRLVWLQNYSSALGDARFWNSVWVQARLSFWTVALQLLIGLGLALLLNSHLRFVERARGLFIIPMVLPPVVVAIVWKILFTPNVSIVYWALGRVGLPQPPWLAHPVLALRALVISDTWEWFPFAFLVLLAALQMMPQEPLEAARIDGAHEGQLFIHIMLPILRPAIVVAGLLRFIESVKSFPHIFVMTGGGPGTATETTNYYAYLQAFSYSFVGSSSAAVVLMVLIVFATSAFVMRFAVWAVDVE